MAKRNQTNKNRSAKLQSANKKNFSSSRGTSAFNKNAKSSDKVDRKAPGKEGMYRTKATIKRLQMYRETVDPNKKVEVRPNKSIRVDSNRKYFGNTRTIDDKNLEKLRKEYEEMKEQNRRTGVLLKKHKIPVSLLSSKLKKTENNLLEPYDKTFGPKMSRTRPKLLVNTLEELAEQSSKLLESYDHNKDPEQQKIIDAEINQKKGTGDKYMTAGQSKRIYSELHKVIDSSDVLCQILDARDPMGTRSSYVENFIKNHCPHKHIVIILNKCDLVPTWVTAKWIQFFNKYFPTIAFHASIQNPFGKPALFQILRQFDVMHRDKKHISVGFIGYPNVGKSSVINTLKKQACCKAAPVPGETRVWQYVTLTKRIYLIDCPGVVYDAGESDTSKILKGVLRCEKIEDPTEHIIGILERTKKEVIQKLYGVFEWTDHEDFIAKVAVKYGKLAKGGDADYKSMSKILLMDWQRGKIPYYVIPNELLNNKDEEKIEEDNVVNIIETTENNVLELKEDEENKDKEDDKIFNIGKENEGLDKNFNKKYQINQINDLKRTKFTEHKPEDE